MTLKSYMADIGMNLWKERINILPFSETIHKLKSASERNTKRYYQEQSVHFRVYISKAK